MDFFFLNNIKKKSIIAHWTVADFGGHLATASQMEKYVGGFYDVLNNDFPPGPSGGFIASCPRGMLSSVTFFLVTPAKSDI